MNKNHPHEAPRRSVDEPGYEKRFAPGASAPDHMRIPATRGLLVALLVVALVAATGVAAGGEDPAVRSFEPESVPHANAPIDATGNGLIESDDGVIEGVDGIAGRNGRAAQVEAGVDPATETRIRIDLEPDRDARWAVVVRYEFTDADRIDAFETVGDRFVDGEVGPGPTLFERFAAEASRTVDRQMEIVDVDRESVVIDDPEAADVEGGSEVVAVGELRLTFVWTAFLVEDGEDLVLGDALTTPDGGTWLRSLEPDQTIEVATPEGYTVSGTPGATVPLRENAVVVEGPRVFEGDERVTVVYSPTATGGDVPWSLLAGSIVVAALLISLGLVGYRRRDPDDGETGTVASSTDAGSGPSDGAAAVEGADGVDGTEPNGTGTAGGAVGSDGESTAEDLSLLSDEERVERLLERNGGRMRQADIVDETGWSDAKVSQLLSAMADEGRVEKLRLGRENLISLPDEDGFGPDADDGSGPDGGSDDEGGSDAGGKGA